MNLDGYITQAKRKFREATESNNPLEKARLFYEASNRYIEAYKDTQDEDLKMILAVLANMSFQEAKNIKQLLQNKLILYEEDEKKNQIILKNDRIVFQQYLNKLQGLRERIKISNKDKKLNETILETKLDELGFIKGGKNGSSATLNKSIRLSSSLGDSFMILPTGHNNKTLELSTMAKFSPSQINSFRVPNQKISNDTNNPTMAPYFTNMTNLLQMIPTLNTFSPGSNTFLNETLSNTKKNKPELEWNERSSIIPSKVSENPASPDRSMMNKKSINFSKMSPQIPTSANQSTVLNTEKSNSGDNLNKILLYAERIKHSKEFLEKENLKLKEEMQSLKKVYDYKIKEFEKKISSYENEDKGLNTNNHVNKDRKMEALERALTGYVKKCQKLEEELQNKNKLIHQLQSQINNQKSF